MKSVSVSAFPKSGVTYLSSLLFYALFERGDPAEIERRYIVDIHISELNDAHSYDGHIFYKSHFPFSLQNRYCALADKVIYLIRDPIDIMRSAYDFLTLLGKKPADLTLDKFAREWILSEGTHFDVAGPWSAHVRSWMQQADRPVLLVRYRTLVDEPVAQLSAILTFLGLDAPRKAIEHAIANSTMGAMRAREEAEFRSKQSGVFFSGAVEKGMAEGARFINKGYHDSYADLGEAEKRFADERFGEMRARYLT